MSEVTKGGKKKSQWKCAQRRGNPRLSHAVSALKGEPLPPSGRDIKRTTSNTCLLFLSPPPISNLLLFHLCTSCCVSTSRSFQTGDKPALCFSVKISRQPTCRVFEGFFNFFLFYLLTLINRSSDTVCCFKIQRQKISGGDELAPSPHLPASTVNLTHFSAEEQAEDGSS